METKHTPGPWEPLRNGIEIQSEEGRHEVFACVNGVPVPICEVHPTMHCEHDDPVGEYVITEDEGLANLHLIAAATDLLDAAKCAISALSQNSTFQNDIEYAKRVLADAIAKATGQ